MTTQRRSARLVNSLVTGICIDGRPASPNETGAEKRDVLQDALAKDYPVAAILRQESTPATIWWTPK